MHIEVQFFIVHGADRGKMPNSDGNTWDKRLFI